jgi:carboxyl-terminal processing protease
MEDNLVTTQESDKKKNRVRVYVFLAAVGLVSVFTTGWLFGSGKISLRSTSIVPTIQRTSSAPTTGLDELYTQLITNFDGEITDEAVLNGMKRGMAAASEDPFTEYLTVEETQAFNDSLDGTFEGIGAELSKEGSFIIIVAPIKGAPAETAGLQPQDIITAIDGESATDISVTEAVNRIRGPKGETVTLTIIRNGEQLEVPIVRDTIVIDSVEWEIEGSTGIMTIGRFGSDTVQLARQAAQEFKAAGVDGVVLDLRGNPGGLLDASVDISNIWLPRGAVVLEEKRGGEVVQTFRTANQPILEGIPTVILINGGSASASEIVAGALRDNDAATLIGEKSFGKGSVQRLIDLRDGGALKVTIARWFTPNGVNIDKEGIAPDNEVTLTPEDREADRDPQLEAAKAAL